MIYLYWWLGFGVLTLVVILGAHLLTKKKESELLHAVLESVNPDRKKLSYRILNHLVAPVLAAVLIVIVWPVTIYMKAKEMLVKGGGGDDVSEGGVSGGRIHLQERSDREFAVERIHLQERLTVQEIHQREIVVDPLNAVPALPFGHLYPRWLALRSGLSENSELWSFSANWEPPWGANEIRCGYVVVNSGLPGSYILTVRKRLEDPA